MVGRAGTVDSSERCAPPATRSETDTLAAVQAAVAFTAHTAAPAQTVALVRCLSPVPTLPASVATSRSGVYVPGNSHIPTVHVRLGTGDVVENVGGVAQALALGALRAYAHGLAPLLSVAYEQLQLGTQTGCLLTTDRPHAPDDGSAPGGNRLRQQCPVPFAAAFHPDAFGCFGTIFIFTIWKGHGVWASIGSRLTLS